MTSTPAIKIEGLTKDFRLGLRGLKLRAVENLSFEVKDNQIFGLLGPNGSGKSTTLKVVLGLLRATRGTCEVYGVPSEKVRSRVDVGYLPEAPYFYRYLTGKELVMFYAAVCGVPKKQRERRTQEVLELVDMQHASDRRVGTYSKGMLQRIGIAQAVVHDPRLVILDEPTAGVDPIGSASIAKMILELKARGKTIILCSHLLAQVEGVCDNIVILDKGHKVVEGKVDDLLEKHDTTNISARNLKPETLAQIRALIASEGGEFLGAAPDRIALDSLFLSKVAPSLEDTKTRD
mgnify:CR=1 FL=1